MREKLCRVMRQVDFSAPSIVGPFPISQSFTRHSPGLGIVAELMGCDPDNAADFITDSLFDNKLVDSIGEGAVQIRQPFRVWKEIGGCFAPSLFHVGLLRDNRRHDLLLMFSFNQLLVLLLLFPNIKTNRVATQSVRR